MFSFLKKEHRPADSAIEIPHKGLTRGSKNTKAALYAKPPVSLENFCGSDVPAGICSQWLLNKPHGVDFAVEGMSAGEIDGLVWLIIDGGRLFHA